MLVVGADVDRRPASRDLRDGGGAVDVAPGALAPGQPAVARGERGDEAVGVAEVHAAVGDRGRRVEVARPQPERAAAGRRRPRHATRRGPHRVHLAGVVAEVQLAALQRQPALHRAGCLPAPAHVAVACPQAVHHSVLRAEVQAPAVDQRGGLRAAGELARPPRGAVLGAQRQDAAGLDALAAPQQDDVQRPVRVGGRGGREVAELALPQHLPGGAGDRVERRVVLEQVQVLPGDDRGELEQHRARELPALGERRAQRHRQRQRARALLGVAVDRPDEGR